MDHEKLGCIKQNLNKENFSIDGNLIKLIDHVFIFVLKRYLK
jgi:hypothetical protein